jgi:hypothetical protein
MEVIGPLVAFTPLGRLEMNISAVAAAIHRELAKTMLASHSVPNRGRVGGRDLVL